MRIGIIGLGKLGLPVALAIESKGHSVWGFDNDPSVMDYIASKQVPYQEEGLPALLDDNHLTLTKSMQAVVDNTDMTFLAIQTPHHPQFEGTTELPEDRSDFDYSYLKAAIAEIAQRAKARKQQVRLAVISTCLPGTFKREIKPLLNRFVTYIYNPFFIAMGTVIEDFYNPEFVLIGRDSHKNRQPNDQLIKFYSTIHNKPTLVTDITTAEAIKVSYNSFITMKTVLANTWGEISHKIGANVDDITKAWGMATDRLISPKYLRAGMGDGGSCHPRDNIALSWLAQSSELSHDLFSDLMLSREHQAKWLAKLVKEQQNGYEIMILGKSFKPNTRITTGSTALLVYNMLNAMGDVSIYDPHVDGIQEWAQQRLALPGCYLIATEHPEFAAIRFAPKSTVIDPFGYIPDQPEVKVIRIGRQSA